MEQMTVCEYCGAEIPHVSASWADDGSSYCEGCHPRDAQAEIARLQSELSEAKESLRLAVKSADLADAAIATARTDALEEAERELAETIDEQTKLHETVVCHYERSTKAEAELAAEKALAGDLDGGLGVAQDIIEAASKQLTKKAGTKWGLWYLDRISELRAAYRKARGL